MATATKSRSKKPVKKTVKSTPSISSLAHYTTIERTGVVLFTLLAISFLLLVLTKFM